MLNKLGQKVRVGKLGQNALAGSAGLGLRALLQAAYLVVLTRVLGPEYYGTFSGSVALAVLVAPLSGWGIGFVYLEKMSRDRSVNGGIWASCILQTLGLGVVLAISVVAIGYFLLGIRIGLNQISLLAVAELLALPLVQVATGVLVSHERGGLGLVAMSLVPLARLAGVTLLLAGGFSMTLSAIVFVHCAGSIFAAWIALSIVARTVVVPDWSRRLPLRHSIAKGTNYAIGGLAAYSYPEVDKILILQLLGGNAAGQYTLAFRIISVLVLPISALISAALPRLFLCLDINARRKILRPLVISAVGYAVVVATVAAMTAPWMLVVFGESFSSSVPLLFTLTMWIPLVAFHQCAAAVLTSTGRQSTRAVIELLGLAGIVVLNVILLPRFSTAGAVYALLATEMFLAVACWSLSIGSYRQRFRAFFFE